MLLPFPAANRDPEAFDQADEVVIDREVNRHAAFGLGIHRCAGSQPGPHGAAGRARGLAGPLPRRSRLADPDAVPWSGGQVRGPRVLPISIGRTGP